SRGLGDVYKRQEELVTGEQIANLNEVQLADIVEKYNVFVKLNPQQKQRITHALKKNGHTVGFLGDGINDAPAMKAADVGISVDTAVDIAKESADVILLEKDLMVL
ncbi:HAD-IC family P-type ATPase, partial [Enterococcus sp. S181_ASV_20]|nr:HAD-IC family P-type ATPase [Enterococcus sp. S181_ASV_20]